MVRRYISVFRNGTYGKPPKKEFASYETDVWYDDASRVMGILDFNFYGLKNIRGYRYILVSIDNSSKNGWTVSLKIEYAQTRID